MRRTCIRILVCFEKAEHRRIDVDLSTNAQRNSTLLSNLERGVWVFAFAWAANAIAGRHAGCQSTKFPFRRASSIGLYLSPSVCALARV